MNNALGGNVFIYTLIGILVFIPFYAGAETPTAEEMWKVIQQQQKVIEELKAKLEQTEHKIAVTETKVGETDKKVETAAEAMEQSNAGTSRATSWTDKTSIGGYGELHFNSTDTKNEVDFHRFVIYFGHEFTDSIRLFSELEVEHALVEEDAPGGVELEQAWVEMDLNQNHSMRAGLDIIPVGILNPTHEPPTFFGVERNPVETEIIPTTWWEAGIGMHGQIAPGWSYDAVVHSGLQTPVIGDDAFLIPEGRNEVAEASAKDGAFTGRLRYTGFPGLEAAITGQYQQDITQSSFANGMDISATLFESHVVYRHTATGLGVRALYARWDLDDGPPGLGPKSGSSPGRNEQYGYYIEPSWIFPVSGVIPGNAGLFARYNYWDNNAGASAKTGKTQLEGGLNYWPIDNLVFKIDAFSQDEAAADSGWNLGIGYQF